MHAIHHIRGLKAVPGHTATSNYITLVFEGEDLSGPLRTEVVLYFESPLEGTLHVLAEGINAAANRALVTAYNEATASQSYEALNEDIPF